MINSGIWDRIQDSGIFVIILKLIVLCYYLASSNKFRINMKKLNILIVDDIFMNRYLIREIVKGLGHSYLDVENGKLAVEALQKDNFDLIIMDIEMPVMNGIETTLYIKNEMNLGDK